MDNSNKQQQIISLLSSFRHLFNDVSRFPNIVLDNLLKLKVFGKVVYPCDVIELRNILTNEEIEFVSGSVLFSFGFAEKYLKRYPVFIVIKENLLGIEKENYGGLVLCKINNLNIEDKVSDIIINMPINKKTTQAILTILKDTGYEKICSFSNSVPGLSSPNPELQIGNKYD